MFSYGYIINNISKIKNMEKILIIEDDIWISNSLKLYLENSWYEINILNSWENAVNEILENNYDIVILDLNLPVKDGITICNEVRKTNNTPIIMLTARSDDKINWLESWADDYMQKPFSPRELTARIKSILRRTKPIEKQNWNILVIKNITIDTDKFIIFKEWNKINLTKNEFDILKKIVSEDWKMVARETLMKDIIWYENYAFDRTIDTHIKNIRKKLGQKDLILTIRWKWYRLNK